MAKKKSIRKSSGKKPSDGAGRRVRKSAGGVSGMGAMDPGEILRQLAEQTGMDPQEILSAIFGSGLDDPEDFRASSHAVLGAAKGRKLKAGSIEFLVDQSRREGDPGKAEILLLQAVEKGQKQLKKEFRENVGDFWAIVKTRPYMQACEQLVHCLLAMQRFDEAVVRMEDMLRLNPNDNQGMRWILLEWYCRLSRFDEASSLLERYSHDESCFVVLTRICLQFQKSGQSAQLTEELQGVLKQNVFVAGKLLSESELNPFPVAQFEVGSEDEAEMYAQRFRSLWKSIPGALLWLKSVVAELPSSSLRSSPEEIKEQAEWTLKAARELKSCRETWYFEFEILDADGHSVDETICFSADDPAEHWLVTVINADTNDAIQIRSGEHCLTPDAAVIELCRAMSEPETGKARRPGVLQCPAFSLCPEIRTALSTLRVTVEEVEEIPPLISFLRRQRLKPDATPFPIEEILELPYTGSVAWEIDWRAINTWVHDSSAGNAMQPWVTMVSSPEDGVVRSHQITTERPSLAIIERTLSDAILNPMSGDPERPSSLTVRQLSHRLELQNTADAINCDLKVGTTPMVDQIVAAMEQRDESAYPEADALIHAEGMDPETLGDFFKASADFYKSRIYMRVRAEQVVEIRCPALSETTHWAVVMGQAGQEIGLMLFFDLKLVKKLLSGRLNNSADSVKHMTGIGYSLSDNGQIHPRDVAAAEQFGWPVPAPDAWPAIYRIEKGKLKNLTTEDLRMATVCIRAALRCHEQSADSLTVKIPLHDQVAEATVRKLKI